MSKIIFLALSLIVCSILEGTKCKFEKEEVNTSTTYTCCANFGARITFIPNNTNLSSLPYNHCENVSIPHTREYYDIVVNCFMMQGYNYWTLENFTHNNFTLPSSVPTISTTVVLTSTFSTATPISIIATEASGSMLVSTSTVYSNSSALRNDAKIGIITAGVVIFITMVLGASLIVTSVCCRVRRKNLWRMTAQKGIGAHLEAGETPTHQTSKAFSTPQQTGEGEERGASIDELVVPFQRSERNEWRASWSRGAMENILDGLEKPPCDIAMLCGIVEDEENVNGVIETYSAPSRSSALQVEEPVSVSVDDHQTPASMQEIEVNKRSTTVSLQPRSPYFLKQSSCYPSVDSMVKQTTDIFTDGGQVIGHNES